MKKGLILGLLEAGAVAFGQTNEERVTYSIKPKTKGGKCTADVKGIKESEGKKLTGFKCNLSDKDKELFEKAGLSKTKTITIYNKDTQKQILDTLSKMNEKDTRFQFDVNFIVRNGLAKDSQPVKPQVSKTTNTSKAIEQKKEVVKKTTTPTVVSKIIKKKSTDNDFILDIGAFDSKLRCFIPSRNIREILKNDGKYIYVDCHKKLGKEMLSGYSNKITINDESLRKEIVDFIRDYHNEHSPTRANYIDTADIPTEKEIKEAGYTEIPILVVAYPTSYRENNTTKSSKDKKNEEITKILEKYKNKYANAK